MSDASSTSGVSSTGNSTGDAEGGMSGTTSTGMSTSMDAPECGDGQLDPGEECDEGFAYNAEEGACLANCVLATCGDGLVHAGFEECDDANAVVTDGCDLGCGRTRRVFVTSAVYQGGEFEGLIGADQRCRSLAAQAGLANFAGFKAWLSDSKTSPLKRMYNGRGRYELVNGLLVAENWDALLAGELQNPIMVTEKSETQDLTVWTGTNPDGTAAAGSDHCLDWTSSDVNHWEFWGVSSEIAAHWTMADVDLNPTQCNSDLAIYCFEQK
ncbi:MAG: hypothetical protein H0T76_10335 [Nannocystis sp.]|nr:hypothetical protein [Nannocystis sp.]